MEIRLKPVEGTVEVMADLESRGVIRRLFPGKDRLLLDSGCLSPSDFKAIRCKKNDPYASFFTMNPFYAHVETCSECSENPPSFYVTESQKLDEKPIALKGYTLKIDL